jgi:hypothetical protein
MGRIVRSTVLLSISTRPSTKNRQRPAQYLVMYFDASPKVDFADTRAWCWVSHVSKSAIFGVDWSWRAAKRALEGKQ